VQGVRAGARPRSVQRRFAQAAAPLRVGSYSSQNSPPALDPRRRRFCERLGRQAHEAACGFVDFRQSARDPQNAEARAIVRIVRSLAFVTLPASRMWSPSKCGVCPHRLTRRATVRRKPKPWPDESPANTVAYSLLSFNDRNQVRGRTLVLKVLRRCEFRVYFRRCQRRLGQPCRFSGPSVSSRPRTDRYKAYAGIYRPALGKLCLAAAVQLSRRFRRCRCRSRWRY
jgi:hypothetical protein